MHSLNDKGGTLLFELRKTVAKSLSLDEFEIAVGASTENYFSTIFPFDVCTKTDRIKLFCKIPKADPGKEYKLTPSKEDLQLGTNEYQSLNILGTLWRNDCDSLFITPVAYIESHNAIITKRVEGDELYLSLRRLDTWGRIFSPLRKESEEIGYRIGRSIALFHQMPVLHNDSPRRTPYEKMAYYLQILSRKKIRLENIQDKILALPSSSDEETKLVNTLKGLDIRNGLYRSDQSLVFLDPGRIKSDYAEADLGRFLATLRLLYWGSVRFGLQYMPQKGLERAVLEGYRSIRSVCDSRLRLFLTKELLKHWVMAYVALDLKRYSYGTNAFMKQFYVDAFYIKNLPKVIEA